MLKKPNDLYLSSFKAISRNLISEIIKYKLPYPYIDGLILTNTTTSRPNNLQFNNRFFKTNAMDNN